MDIYIVDSFSDQIFGGNQAGVVLLDRDSGFPDEKFMINLAAELKHSETAYVKLTGDSRYSLRYFTPAAEVNLCGHATIAAFTVLRDTGRIGEGEYWADTLAGALKITVSGKMVWMDMTAPELVYTFSRDEWEPLYRAYGLDLSSKPEQLPPCIVNTGLSDILLPVKDSAVLDQAVMNTESVNDLTRTYKTVGVHMFCLSREESVTGFCRNFAPLYGIPEEPATGTSNGALTYYLRLRGLVSDGTVNTFLQGRAMGRGSRICTTIDKDHIRVGGSGKICLECRLHDPCQNFFFNHTQG